MPVSAATKCTGCGAPNPAARAACYACGRALLASAAATRPALWKSADPRWLAGGAMVVLALGAILAFARAAMGPANLMHANLRGRNMARAHLNRAQATGANLT